MLDWYIVTSRNPWASSRNVKQPMKLQSGVYWNNTEARTSSTIVSLKVMLWDSCNCSTRSVPVLLWWAMVQTKALSNYCLQTDLNVYGVPLLKKNKFPILYLSRVQTPPSSWEEKGSGVTSRNPWVSSRNVEQPMELQSGVYWNNTEARTSTTIVPLKVMLWDSSFNTDQL